ncbi:hypothetical protein DF947_10610 [Pedobacter paludis]|uniref:Uncharacterized protein n=1 Tax=Pedobacter paludis TaxID=2203212 RepID=A0A317F0G8_9SPHI|nr:hypothetical protein DF947_10610 [Pedobacter paludis]
MAYYFKSGNPFFVPDRSVLNRDQTLNVQFQLSALLNKYFLRNGRRAKLDALYRTLFAPGDIHFRKRVLGKLLNTGDGEIPFEGFRNEKFYIPRGAPPLETLISALEKQIEVIDYYDSKLRHGQIEYFWYNERNHTRSTHAYVTDSPRCTDRRFEKEFYALYTWMQRWFWIATANISLGYHGYDPKVYFVMPLEFLDEYYRADPLIIERSQGETSPWIVSGNSRILTLVDESIESLDKLIKKNKNIDPTMENIEPIWSIMEDLPYSNFLKDEPHLMASLQAVYQLGVKALGLHQAVPV